MNAKFLAAVGLASLLAAWAAPAGAEEVVSGAPYPLSGPMASYSGPFLRQGTLLAVDRINAEHMLGPDRTLKVDIEDNAGDRNQAISLMNRFASSPALGVLGVYGSFLSLPAAPVANDLKIPLLAIAISTAIPKAGPWSFTELEPAEISMTALGEYVTSKLHVKKMALIYDRSNDASVRMNNALRDYVVQHGTKIVSQDTITAQDTNFQPIATKVVNEDIDSLFFEAVPPVTANFLIQARQAGLDPDIKVMSSGQASSPVFYNIAGKAGNGLLFAVEFLPSLPGKERETFVAAYRKKYNKDPDQNAAWGYQGTMLFARAIAAAGPHPDRAKVRDALAAIRNAPSVLGAGTFSFTADRVASYPSVVVQVENGKAVPVE
jgi:branched-chain amino acid transport system substrate-binding protein